MASFLNPKTKKRIGYIGLEGQLNQEHTAKKAKVMFLALELSRRGGSKSCLKSKVGDCWRTSPVRLALCSKNKGV